ncbi:hypothetical protein [Krasilnikovia sp. M28-CT-15]|uniref:hypothetical protein n=1 Tax=Krasilnikovia sp. M28-CT-15 TaxID=3373540 RepID=UPI003876894F
MSIPTRPLVWTLTALEAAVAVSAVYGAVMLVIDAWHLPVTDLSPLPLDSWVLPGVALLATVALPMGLAAYGLGRRCSWAAPASIIAGTLLSGWVLVQVAVIGPQMFLQGVLFAVGLVVAVLGLMLDRTRTAGIPHLRRRSATARYTS